MKRILFVLVVLFFLSSSFIAGIIFKNQFPSNYFITQYQPKDPLTLWAIVQNWRLESKLNPYTNSQTTCDVADTRVQDIQFTFSHTKFIERYSDRPYVLSENLGEGYQSELQMFSAWLGSPSHKENLLQTYRYSCLRCLNDKCVQIFSDF